MAKPVKIGIIGSGSIAGAHVRGYKELPDVEIAAVADVIPGRAQEFIDRHELGAAKSFDDHNRLLELDLDGVSVCTPNVAHHRTSIDALEAGKHVLTEKPMAVEVAEADRMLAEADRCGRVLAVAFQQRTRFEVREARRLIAQGFLGELQRAEVLATWPRRRTYFEVAPWRGSWRGEGGGVLVNQGQHDLDLLCHLAGPRDQPISLLLELSGGRHAGDPAAVRRESRRAE